MRDGRGAVFQLFQADDDGMGRRLRPMQCRQLRTGLDILRVGKDAVVGILYYHVYPGVHQFTGAGGRHGDAVLASLVFLSQPEQGLCHRAASLLRDSRKYAMPAMPAMISTGMKGVAAPPWASSDATMKPTNDRAAVIMAYGNWVSTWER